MGRCRHLPRLRGLYFTICTTCSQRGRWRQRRNTYQNILEHTLVGTLKWLQHYSTNTPRSNVGTLSNSTRHTPHILPKIHQGCPDVGIMRARLVKLKPKLAALNQHRPKCADRCLTNTQTLLDGDMLEQFGSVAPKATAPNGDVAYSTVARRNIDARLAVEYVVAALLHPFWEDAQQATQFPELMLICVALVNQRSGVIKFHRPGWLRLAICERQHRTV